MIAGDEVEQVYVLREHCGTGVARALIAGAERLIRANGYTRAWLAVVAGNARARRFYERSGWSDGGEFDYTVPDGGGEISIPCHRYEKDVH